MKPVSKSLIFFAKKCIAFLFLDHSVQIDDLSTTQYLHFPALLQPTFCTLIVSSLVPPQSVGICCPHTFTKHVTSLPSGTSREACPDPANNGSHPHLPSSTLPCFIYSLTCIPT